MLQQMAKDKYSIETLRELNVSYDREHWLTQDDVDMAMGKGHSVQNILPSRQWKLHKAVAFSNGICRLIYRNPCRM